MDLRYAQLYALTATAQGIINTDPSLGMPTTLGTPALWTARTKGNAKIIVKACFWHSGWEEDRR